VGGQGALNVHHRGDSLCGAGECHEEGIPLGVDLAAVPFGEGIPEDIPLVSQQGCVLVAQSIQQLCRAFDVSE
jgi:hypothetical protein